MGRLQALARRALAAVGLVTAGAARAQALRETAFRAGFERRYRELLARYDAAQTTGDNTKHWAAADCLSPNAANSPEVRQKLRNRARYECANNSYAHGIALTLANDCVGTGPRLQLLSPNEAANSLLEELFAEWAAEAQLAAKLKTMRLSKVWDGESFGLLTTNRRFTGPVKLDLRLVEAEQVADSSMLPDPTSVDGIQFDEWGNPVSYRVLKTHPGDLQFRGPSDFFVAPVESVLHYFTVLRPSQARGIPEITPALPLFAQLRRYTLAVIAAAETAADMAMVIESGTPANDEDVASLDAMDTIELERRMATVLPQGWKLGQTKPEQPTTTYGDFKREILNEIARCLSMPFNVAAGNSSGYNYSSGRLDHQTYYRSIGCEQALMERTLLDRIFAAWLNEAVLVEGLVPQSFRGLRIPKHQWFWDGSEHVDPAKEANAQATRLTNMTTSLATEYAREGKDWRQELKQIAAERKLLDELGLPLPGAAAPAAAGAPEEEPDTDPDDGEERAGDGEDGDEGAEPAGKVAPKAAAPRAAAKSDDVAAMKVRLDAMGLAVRSGAVTPQASDEEHVRAELGLPPMEPAVRQAWKDEPVRRPVTLAAADGGAPAPAPAPAAVPAKEKP